MSRAGTQPDSQFNEAAGWRAPPPSCSLWLGDTSKSFSRWAFTRDPLRGQETRHLFVCVSVSPGGYEPPGWKLALRAPAPTSPTRPRPALSCPPTHGPRTLACTGHADGAPWPAASNWVHPKGTTGRVWEDEKLGSRLPRLRLWPLWAG